MSDIVIAQISCCYMYWRECVRRLNLMPYSVHYQRMSMNAQAQLVMMQAIYSGEK